MKALTLTQPWATLVAIGEKCIETRSWSTKYRGPLAIHAAKGFPREAQSICLTEPFVSVLLAHGITDQRQLPVGVVVAVATLGTCYRFDHQSFEKLLVGGHLGRWPEHEARFGDYTSGRFGFRLDNVVALAAPVPARGMLGLWELPAETERVISRQLSVAAGAACP